MAEDWEDINCITLTLLLLLLYNFAQWRRKQYASGEANPRGRGTEVPQKLKVVRKICAKFGQICRRFFFKEFWQFYFICRAAYNCRRTSCKLYIFCNKIWPIYAEIASKNALFINNSVVYRDVFHNPVLQTAFKNCICTVALMTVCQYTAAYLITGACS